jgi:hypothetical protein
MVPARFKRAQCFKRCHWYDPAQKGKCRLEVEQAQQPKVPK